MFKNSIKVFVLLSTMILAQSCEVLAIPLAAPVLPVFLAFEEFGPKIENKKSFFGEPYLGFRTNVESMTGKDVFGHVMDNPLGDGPGIAYIFLLPGNIAMGTLFLPFDLWALAFESDDLEEAKGHKDKRKSIPRAVPKKKPLVAKLTSENQVHCRYARLESSKAIQMAEFKLFSKGINLALAGDAKQSATNQTEYASRAIDNNVSGGGRKKSLSNTGRGPAWWEVDLGIELPVDKLEVWKRTYFSKRKGHYPHGMDDVTISLYDNEHKLVWSTTIKSRRKVLYKSIRKAQTL